MWEADTMMPMQMPKFAKFSSDFICICEKIAGGQGSAQDPIVTAVRLYILTSLAYDRVMEECFWDPGKVLGIFVTKRVGTLQIAMTASDECGDNLLWLIWDHHSRRCLLSLYEKR